MTETAAPSRRFFRPTWAEVRLGVLKENLRRLRSRLPRKTGLLLAVKADAYGHGAAACALAASERSWRPAPGARPRPLADMLGVASVEEGMALREAGVRLPILVLGSLFPFESFLAAAAHDLVPTVASLGSARRLVETARSLGRRVPCHLKVETGMNRIGAGPAASIAVAAYLAGERSVKVEGVYTHLASAETSPAFTRSQLALFRRAWTGIARVLGTMPLRHAANSAALLRHRASHLDLVRSGLAAYGLCEGFEPVLSLKSKVVFMKTVPKGTPVSYGGTYRTRRTTRLATIPIGYADGLSRGLSNRGHALLGGRRVPIVGRVTMDMLMLDATSVPNASVGDDAVLIGRQGASEITAGEVARRLGTIPYEVTCSVASRVPRVHLS